MKILSSKSALIGIGLILVFSIITFLKHQERILFKGQVNKQFHSHSITQSLSNNGYSITETSVPCAHPNTGESPRKWAEEPPFFHITGAVLKNLGIQSAGAFPLVVSISIALILFLLLSSISPNAPSLKIALSVLLIFFTPVLSRYQLQHMPDTLGILFLFIGFYFFIKEKRVGAILFFALAVTQKALLIFALFPFTLVAFSNQKSFQLKFYKDLCKRGFITPLVKTLLLCLFCSIPFIFWIMILEQKGIPAPFSFSSSLENRHSGSFHHLFEMGYWARLFRWWIPKGIGVPLFFGALYALYTHVKENVGFTKTQLMILLWALGLFPYWILVRESNFIHDYYFLPFFFPWGWLGVQGLLDFPIKKLKYALILMSIIIGMKEGFSLKEVAKDHTQSPKFCDAETKSY